MEKMDDEHMDGYMRVVICWVMHHRVNFYAVVEI